MKKFYALSFILTWLSHGVHGQDWKSIHIKGRFDTIHESFRGETWQKVQDLQNVDTLILNAIRCEVYNLHLNGNLIEFQQNDTALFIPIKEGMDSAELYINYQVNPRKGLFFLGWQDSTYRSRRQIWTQGQGIDHRHWIPHNDNQRDKILFSAEWIFNADYELMSNGTLDSTRLVEGDKHWFYSMDKPMSSYLIAVAIDRYELSLSTVNSIPHQLYHYPERREDASWYYYKHDSIAAFLESEIDYPYPWPNYKQAPVQDFRHGAMENTCATIFGDFFLVDEWAFADQNYTYVDAHEFAHQWFGNLVTAAGSEHHWLHEGFATYYQWLSERALYGEDFFAWELEKARILIEEATASETLPLAHPKAGSSRFYQKGAWLLYMLRDYVGDSVYRATIDDYLNQYAYQVVENKDLIALFDTNSGRDVKAFFDLWLYADKEPILKIQRKSSSDVLDLELSASLPQELILVERHGMQNYYQKLHLKKGRQKLKLRSAESSFYFANYRDLLVQVEEEKSVADWMFQFEDASSFAAQYFSLLNLVGQTGPGILQWSRSIAEQEELHFGLRLQAFEIYSSQAIPDSRKVFLLQQLLQSDDVSLQKGLLEIARREQWSLDSQLLEPLRRGPSYKLRSLALQLSLNPRDPKANLWLYDSLYQLEPGILGHEVHQEALLYRVWLFQDLEAYHQLMDYGTRSFDFNTRIRALQYLSLLPAPSPSKYLDLLWQAFFNSNWKLVRVAREGLKKERERDSNSWEEYYQVHFRTWTDFQKRKAERTFGE